MNLLDLVLFSTVVYNEWNSLAKEIVVRAMQSGVWAGSGADEDAHIDSDGSLLIFAQLGSERAELRVPKGEWSITRFDQLPPEVQLWIIGMIAEKIPRDRRSRGIDWQGKLFGYIEAKGYISPDGKVFRFKYQETGPFQCLSEGAVFGYSLGDAAPPWAK